VKTYTELAIKKDETNINLFDFSLNDLIKKYNPTIKINKKRGYGARKRDLKKIIGIVNARKNRNLFLKNSFNKRYEETNKNNVDKGCKRISGILNNSNNAYMLA